MSLDADSRGRVLLTRDVEKTVSLCASSDWTASARFGLDILTRREESVG